MGKIIWICVGAVIVWAGTILLMHRIQTKKIKKLEDDYREKQRVQQKLREEYSVKVQNKQAKIAALQSQINPHFCTIRWNVYEVRRFYMNVTALPVWRRRWRLFSGIASATKKTL